MKNNPYEGLNWDQIMERIRQDNQRFMDEMNRKPEREWTAAERVKYNRIRYGSTWGRGGYG